MNNSSEITDVTPKSDAYTVSKRLSRHIEKQGDNPNLLTAQKQKPGARFVDYSGPRGIKHIRRDNLRGLVEKYTPAVVAEKVGWKTRSFISQMIGEEPCNPVTESTARRVEKAFDLPHGFMDVDHWVKQPVQAAFGMPNTPAVKTNDYTPPIDAILLGDVMQRVAAVCAEMGATSTPARQAWLVTTVFADALDHGGVVRDNFIRQLVRAPV